MTHRILIFSLLAVGSAPVLAQDLPRYPGLSPTQERLLNPIPLPPPALGPSAPVPMIVPPAPIVSAPPPLTLFPGGGGGTVNPVDRRERTPREALPTAARAGATPEPMQKPDGSKETPWQTVILPPPPDFSRGAGTAGPSAGSEAAAKAAIEADGYRQVKGLARGSDGQWRGRALRGSAEVAVTVDVRGNVSAN